MITRDPTLTEAERCGVRVFHLVVDSDKAYADRNQQGIRLHDALSGLSTGLSRMQFTFASPRKSEYGHARYLLGNYSGLQFDHGFDVDDHLQQKSRQQNLVHWLTDDVLGQLHREYGWA